MNKWEYTAIVIPEDKSVPDELNSFGKENWELVTVLRLTSEWIAFFKRPMQ